MKIIRLAYVAILVTWSLMAAAQTDHYLDRLIDVSAPDWSQLTDMQRILYSEGMRASASGEPEVAIDAYSQLAEGRGEETDLRLATHALARLALSQEAANQHPMAMQTLAKIKALRQDPEGEEIRFLVDLETARAMAQCGGHPDIPGFDPTIAEKERQFQVVFDTYSPYKRQVINAHLLFAQQAYAAAMRGGGKENTHYMEVGLEHLRKIREVVGQIEANPSLAPDAWTLESLSFFREWVSAAIPRWEGTYRSLVAGPTPEEEMSVFDSILEDSPGKPQSASSAAERANSRKSLDGGSKDQTPLAMVTSNGPATQYPQGPPKASSTGLVGGVLGIAATAFVLAVWAALRIRRRLKTGASLARPNQ